MVLINKVPDKAILNILMFCFIFFIRIMCWLNTRDRSSNRKDFNVVSLGIYCLVWRSLVFLLPIPELVMCRRSLCPCNYYKVKEYAITWFRLRFVFPNFK